MSLLDPLKFIGGPGFVIFLVLALALGVVVARRPSRYRLAALAWTTVVGTGALILALPAVAHGIVGRLPPIDPGATACSGELETLIVFDGDNRRGRLAEALRLWHGHSPRVIVVSGGEWLVGELLAAGVPGAIVRQDESAATTREQVWWLGRVAAHTTPCQIGVIASEIQMPRVAALLRTVAVPVSLFPSPPDAEVPAHGFSRFLPSYAALRMSRDALYELVAVAYYEGQGWIHREPEVGVPVEKSLFR